MESAILSATDIRVSESELSMLMGEQSSATTSSGGSTQRPSEANPTRSNATRTLLGFAREVHQLAVQLGTHLKTSCSDHNHGVDMTGTVTANSAIFLSNMSMISNGAGEGSEIRQILRGQSLSWNRLC